MILVILLLFIFNTSISLSQVESLSPDNENLIQKDSVNRNNSNFFVYPYAFYTPETNLAVGASAITYFRLGTDSLIKPSKVSLSGYCSINKQWNISFKPNFYFLRNNIHTVLHFEFTKMIDKFYGIGNETEDFDSAAYDLRFNRFKLDFNVKLFDSDVFSSGLTFDIGKYEPYNTYKNPRLSGDSNLIGVSGGYITGTGINLVFDSRDNIFYPIKGYFHQIKIEYFDKIFDNSYSFPSIVADLRFFQKVVDESIGVLGLQIYGDITSGDVPYFMLPKLGGPSRMRGYYDGRYRDKIFYMSQIEFRKKLFSRFMAAFFFGIGKVSDDINKLSFEGMHPSFGFGIRYMLDVIEKLNIRFDIGISKDGNTGVYFAIEEAF